MRNNMNASGMNNNFLALNQPGGQINNGTNSGLGVNQAIARNPSMNPGGDNNSNRNGASFIYPDRMNPHMPETL